MEKNDDKQADLKKECLALINKLISLGDNFSLSIQEYNEQIKDELQKRIDKIEQSSKEEQKNPSMIDDNYYFNFFCTNKCGILYDLLDDVVDDAFNYKTGKQRFDFVKNNLKQAIKIMEEYEIENS